MRPFGASPFKPSLSWLAISLAPRVKAAECFRRYKGGVQFLDLIAPLGVTSSIHLLCPVGRTGTVRSFFGSPKGVGVKECALSQSDSLLDSA